MAIEDLVLWTGFVTGLLGAFAFVWQVVQYLASRSQHRVGTLNTSVLKPWSSVTVTPLYRPPDTLALRIPKEAFPAEVSRIIPDDGLNVDELTGLSKGKTYLHRSHPSVSRQWVLVERHLNEYEEARLHRAEIAESLVRDGMARSYPDLSPSSWQEQGKGTYIPETIKNVVEARSYWIASGHDSLLGTTKSRQQSGEVIYYSLSEVNSTPLLFCVSEEQADETKMLGLLNAWVHNLGVQEQASKMVESREDLEQSVDGFRKLLKELNLEIDQTAG